MFILASDGSSQNRVFEFIYQRMNMFEYVQWTKNYVRVCWFSINISDTCLIYFRPTCCTVEDLATDLRAREVSEVPVSEPLPNDLPPKYEELDQPPRYEDHVRPNVDETQQRWTNLIIPSVIEKSAQFASKSYFHWIRCHPTGRKTKDYFSMHFLYYLRK